MLRNLTSFRCGAMFFACLMGLFYFTVRFGTEQSWGSVAGAGITCCLGTLTRYEAWFLIPFVAVYLGVVAKGRRWLVAAVFALVAEYTGDPLMCRAPTWSAAERRRCHS